MPREPTPEYYDNDEVSRRRDAVIRRMANTPPQPHVTPKVPARKAKESGGGPGLSRPPRGRGASAAKPAAEH